MYIATLMLSKVQLL